MAKKVSKYFRIGVEGDTCDGRVIDADDINQMAESFDPRVYGCRINLEHLKSYSPDSTFRRYGDVIGLKAETIEDDSALNGKRALFAQISPTDELVLMNKDRQKIYTSMEIRPNFANSGKAYLVGLAVTDDPASLGTEMLEFSAKAKHNPLAARKSHPDNFFSAAVEVQLEFEDVAEPGVTLLSMVKSVFSRKQATDDARFNDVHEAVNAVAVHVQEQGETIEARFTSIEKQFADQVVELKQSIEKGKQGVTSLETKLSITENFSQTKRPESTGGNNQNDVLTDC
ncbi:MULTISPECIES: GPO family capsid scaffolding protein [Yersinia]|uniref:GPO family capsid scaffolding protein n=1 Tax=Yersinia TaxID=629 RepID=UPI0005E918D0|nr:MULTISPECIES: GPO family capsid scaffolding protein [Yersinia]EKN3559840.1 GPO family capsid scaffolding protein [Yersinia enterocolitica]EKN3870815.1 GPO family capsid scaffolding protein [Yersinia enterocolitica]EKN3987820.1 GPO family capsid scaffolding protein [Yersinia enterocolitica]EKN4113405.1 GPO family capsid scaffolding protein [Yersinia enterocolitica]EKN4750407.1 GPO family capsid scaffolding protein [Yersinia enterocolitica]